MESGFVSKRTDRVCFLRWGRSASVAWFDVLVVLPGRTKSERSMRRSGDVDVPRRNISVLDCRCASIRDR